MKCFRSASGQDSSSAEIEEEIMRHKADSNDVLESLRQVQEQVKILHALIGGMKKKLASKQEPINNRVPANYKARTVCINVNLS